jgi:uncharacterized membrane protein YkoI
MNALFRRMPLLLALALALAGGALHASDREGDEYDHERARRAVEAGQARPLAEILAEVADKLGGKVVGVEFEREYGRYVYEFKIVTPAGRLREVYVDAMSAEVLKTEDD